MSSAKVHCLADRIRTRAAPDEKIDIVAREVDAARTDIDKLDVLARQNAEAQRATGDAVVIVGEAIETLHGKVDQLLERVDGAEVHAMRARGDARRAEEAADRAMHLSAADVSRIAEAVRPVVQAPIVQAGKQGVARGVGGALAALGIGGAAAFAKDPVAFVDAFSRMFGGG